jgi:regulator of RNase E activity RraA
MHFKTADLYDRFEERVHACEPLSRDVGGVNMCGCVREFAGISRMALGPKALSMSPPKSARRHEGNRDVQIAFEVALFQSGGFLYCDGGGILVSAAPLVDVQEFWSRVGAVTC